MPSFLKSKKGTSRKTSRAITKNKTAGGFMKY